MLPTSRIILRGNLPVAACAILFVIFLLNLSSSAAAWSLPATNRDVPTSVSPVDQTVSPNKDFHQNRHTQVNDRRSPKIYGTRDTRKDSKTDVPASGFAGSFGQPFSWFESAIRTLLVGIMTTIRQYAQHLPGSGDYCS